MKPRESGSKPAATAIRKKFVSKEYIDAHFFFFFQKGRKRLSLLDASIKASSSITFFCFILKDRECITNG
jgi:hypothetical protein